MGEPSIVIELQQLASDSTSSVTEMLRKSLVVAMKLSIADFKKWIECELDGYGRKETPIPEYRRIFAEIKAYNPYNNFNMPVAFLDARMARQFSATAVQNSISELEEMAKSGSQCVVNFSPEELNFLANCAHPDFREMPPKKYIASNMIVGIVENVRNSILKWALNLEASGIMGYGMTFSDDEKKAANRNPSMHIGNIGTFTGNFAAGDISARGNIEISGFSSINDQLKNAGLSQAERNELEIIMDSLKDAKPAAKAGFAKSGMDWIKKNKAALGTLAVQLGAYFAEHHKA